MSTGAGRPHGKLTCMWQDGVFLGFLATLKEGIMVQNRHGVGPTRTVWRKTARARWERSNLEIIVVVPWRKNEDETVPRWDGDYMEKLEMEKNVLASKSVRNVKT